MPRLPDTARRFIPHASSAGSAGVTAPAASSETGTVFRIHRHVDEELVQQWQQLAEDHGTRFAARPAYGLGWHEALGKGRLAVATLHRGDQLVGVFPLHVRRRLGIPSHRWLGHGLGTVGETVTEDATALDELLAGLRRAGVQLELTHVAEGAPLLAALRRSPDWVVEYRADEYCPTIAVPAGTTVRDLRSAKTLRRFRVARTRAAENHGPVEFVTVRSPTDVEKHWPDLLRVVSAALRENPAKRLNFFTGPHGDFTRRFLHREAEQGHLLLNALTVDSTWVAFDVLLQTGSRVEGWLTFFDPAYRKYIPGHLLTERLVDHHDELGITEIDQMIGRNPYKQDWQTAEYVVGTARAVPADRAWLLPVARRLENGIAAARTGVGRGRGKLAELARRRGRASA